MDEMRNATIPLATIDKYLNEKLSPSQLNWVNGNERYAVNAQGKKHLVQGSRHSLEVKNIPFKYWDRVILPELTRLFRVWNAKMIYDIDPDLDLYTGSTMLRQINIHLFAFDKGFAVTRQRNKIKRREQ